MLWWLVIRAHVFEGFEVVGDGPMWSSCPCLRARLASGACKPIGALSR